jgi:hypothetical protein
MLTIMKKQLPVLGVLLCLAAWVTAQNPNLNYNKFKQLKEELPTPNVYRTASGAPGHEYYQQRADYVMEVEIDEDQQVLRGEETITYFNQSPDVLTYLWVQLDQNMRAKDSDTYKIRTNDLDEQMTFGQVKRLHNQFDGGHKIEYVKDAEGNDLKYTINKTMMRVDMPEPLAPGETFTFDVKWWYNINNHVEDGGRSGYEFFPEDGNSMYNIAQFFPRMAVYNDVEGWQNKQFLGRGEFALVFGNYDVKITVPADHAVASTGTLQNPREVLTSEQRKRLDEARKNFDDPVVIITQEEATANEAEASEDTKTWHFKADMVRDFAFASSRKFIWDAMAVDIAGETVMAMSMYPKEGNPLWGQYSTRAVAHTLRVYSKYTFDYPYPIAWSIDGSMGMEYPMICFNYGRPEKDGTYSQRTKYGHIGVIIHEVGHNYFPMIVNSDERQWTWMDEGLNSFVQAIAQQEWEDNWGRPIRGIPSNIVDYMKLDKSRLSPIMTNSESIWNFGNNAYAKPATALYILRETILGRELFDMAFMEYAQRWKFKHPTPADFFRTMEDASGVDLDWFWRGWFYSTDHVDIALADVKWFQVSSMNPDIEKPLARKRAEEAPTYVGDERFAAQESLEERDADIKDFYNEYDPFEVTVLDRQDYQRYLQGLSDEDKELLEAGYNYYSLTFENEGGLVMPILLEFRFTDGTSEEKRIPAEIWKLNHDQVSKVFFFEKEVEEIVLDPHLETADTDRDNNYWPERRQPTRFELFKRRSWSGGENPMQRSRRAEQMENQGSGGGNE